MRPGAMPAVGIVIVNYQSWEPLRACLQELLSADNEAIDIVVVDNDSPNDRLAEFAAEFPRVRFVRNPGNPGFAHGCNTGAQFVTGEVLLFLNPDTIMSPVTILELAAEFCAQQEFGVVSPVIENAEGCRQATGEVFPGLLTQLPLGRKLARKFAGQRWERASTSAFVSCDYVPGCALMIRRETFEAMGGWATEFWMYCEDIDLCWRVREQGMRVGWSNQHVAKHLQGVSSGSSEDSAVRCRAEHVRARHLLYARHLGGVQLGMTQFMEAAKRLLRLLPAALVDVLTRGRKPRYRIRRRTLASLLSYYRNWWHNGPAAPIGEWRSR